MDLGAFRENVNSFLPTQMVDQRVARSVRPSVPSSARGPVRPLHPCVRRSPVRVRASGGNH